MSVVVAIHASRSLAREAWGVTVIVRMTSIEMLINLFRRVEDAKSSVRVSFDDGSRYDLLILSTGHAEEGGDIIASVVRSIESVQPNLWKAGAINFKLEDVVRVESQDECLFSR